MHPHRNRIRSPLLYFVPILILAGLACDLSGLTLGVASPSQPESEQRRLFQGVTYQRIVKNDPRPLVIHVVTIDLKADGIKTLVTAGDPGPGPAPAAPTTLPL